MKKHSFEDVNIDQIMCLAEIGKSSIGLFHDVLNPISGLIMYLDLIKKDKQIDQNIRKNMKPIFDSSKQIQNFIKSIQTDFSSDSSSVSEIVKIDEIILNTIKILNYRSKQNNVSIYFLRQKNMEIKFNKLKMYQVFINLISNAIDSFESISDNRIRKVNIAIDNYNDGLNENIIINISDNGCGIEKEKQNKIFEHLYTTKQSGTGIGLTHTKNIIEKNLGGEIKLTSQLNVGTTFTVTIPKNKYEKNPHLK